MIDFRVDDLEALVGALERDDVDVDPERVDDENGCFAWIVDLEGNRVELWEPKRRSS